MTSDNHGTAVAGVAAARGNNYVGGAGAAYEATLVGLRLTSDERGVTDDVVASAMAYRNDVISIKNNSWEFTAPFYLPKLTSLALENGAAIGRNGKGTLYVFAAGNSGEKGKDANYNALANSIYSIAVGAVNMTGSIATYSNPGACLIVSAPSGEKPIKSANFLTWLTGITTTDRTSLDGYNSAQPNSSVKNLDDLNYTRTFGGTSAAAPLVSGVLALLLQANPDLGWRDVQEILVKSASLIDPLDGDWHTNGSGIWFNHKYGGGLIDAATAIALATNWINLGPQTNLARIVAATNRIPDNDSKGVTLDFDFANTDLRVEHATLAVSFQHPRLADLAITLISPRGMQSRLAEKNTNAVSNVTNWTFTSVFHWGESSKGIWHVNIADLAPGSTGGVSFLKLTLLGTTKSPPPRIISGNYRQNQFHFDIEGRIGQHYAIESSTNLVSWSLVTNHVLRTDSTGFTESTNLTNRRFYRIRALTNAPSPPQITKHPASQSVRDGFPIVLTATVIFDGAVTFQWLRNVNNPLPGATNQFLYLASPSTNDSGFYQVRVRNASGEVYSQGANIKVYLPPPYFYGATIEFTFSDRSVQTAVFDQTTFTYSGNTNLTSGNYTKSDSDFRTSVIFQTTTTPIALSGETRSTTLTFTTKTTGSFQRIYKPKSGQPSTTIGTFVLR